MIEAVVDPIRNRPVSEDGSKAASTGFKQIAGATDIEETFMLARKARCGQILGRGGAPHGNSDVGAVLHFELSIGCCNILPQAISPRGIEDDRTCFGSTFGKYIYVRLIETI